MKTTAMTMWMVGAVVAMGPMGMAGQAPTQPATNVSGQAMASASPAPFGTDSSLNGGAATDPQVMRDKIFVHHATDGGFAGVQFGQLATQQGGSADVKKFGQRVMVDHAALADAMKPYADQMGVRVPTKLGRVDQEEFDKLKGLSGAAFDKEYLAFTLKDHEKDLQEFQAEVAGTEDASLRETAAKAATITAKHLRWAGKLAAMNGVAAKP
jgi:putative membrane protein